MGIFWCLSHCFGMIQKCIECIEGQSSLLLIDDKTLPNFIKRKHPWKGEKNKQEARTKVQASKQPKRGRPLGGKGTTSNRTLNPIKLQA
jgi:hypothetical protein